MYIINRFKHICVLKYIYLELCKCTQHSVFLKEYTYVNIYHRCQNNASMTYNVSVLQINHFEG